MVRDMSEAATGAPRGSDAGRIGDLLGVSGLSGDLDLADRVAEGLSPGSADALARVLGAGQVVGQIVPEATLRRARKLHRRLSREMSERLYEVGRVVDAANRAYHGDRSRMLRFLTTPHPLLDGREPLAVARSSSAGADAVLNLLRRAEAGFAL